MPKGQPEGYHSVIPFFQVKDADRLVDFVRSVFDAEGEVQMRRPDGKVGHAEYTIGDSVVMITEGDAMPLAVYVYVEDVDAVHRKAVQAGGRTEQEPADQFWGDRQSAVKDEWGNMWFIATNKETVSPEEIQPRLAAMPPRP